MSSSPSAQSFTDNSVPVQAGIGLKFEHIPEVLESNPTVGWFEVHAENFMSDGGPSIHALEQVRSAYPISVHGVGLSIGGMEPLDVDHLKRLKRVVDHFDPGLVSEHLAWCIHDGKFLNDLLPVAYTQSSLSNVVEHINQTQEFLDKRILIENPSLYVSFNQSEISEPDFLNELATRTGCGLLLDINNVYVSASNLQFDPQDYLDKINMEFVSEIHLAGHHEKHIGDQILRIDDHGSRVCDDVWKLYSSVIEQNGPIPTLIEWDTGVPSLITLLEEADSAQKILTKTPTIRGRYDSAA